MCKVRLSSPSLKYLAPGGQNLRFFFYADLDKFTKILFKSLLLIVTHYNFLHCGKQMKGLEWIDMGFYLGPNFARMLVFHHILKCFNDKTSVFYLTCVSISMKYDTSVLSPHLCFRYFESHFFCILPHLCSSFNER